MSKQSDGDATGRRTVLEQLGRGALALPLVAGSATRGSAETDAARERADADAVGHQFEIWAADHIGFDYTLVADGPVRHVTHPQKWRGAEPTNDNIVSMGGGRYRVEGHTGNGYDDTFETGEVHRIVIEDAEIL